LDLSCLGAALYGPARILATAGAPVNGVPG